MRKLEKSDVIKRFRSKHGNKYDYSNVDYINSKTKVKIICPIHGEFEQTPDQHFNHGCKKCGVDVRVVNQTHTNEDFIKKSKLVHGNRYDYSLVEYRGHRHKVKVICKNHGVFLTTPANHINKKSGCRKCGDRCKGWSFSEWVEMAVKSRYFDSYKLYVLRMYNDLEYFYKVGITYRKISVRFDSNECMPYNYDVIKLIEVKDQSDKIGARHLYDLEKRFKRIKSNKQYTPLIPFGGMYECFK